MNVSSVNAIRAALERLPAKCQYHGEKVSAVERWGREDARYGGACCATGENSLLRRHALKALDAEVAVTSMEGRKATGDYLDG
jgi:hypothetical protein